MKKIGRECLSNCSFTEAQQVRQGGSFTGPIPGRMGVTDEQVRQGERTFEL
jgi:hypothetical protein